MSTSHVLHRSTNLPTTVVTGGSGIVLHTSDGDLIDAVSGTSVAVLGHGEKYKAEIAAAIQAQISQVSFVYSGTLFTTPAVEELASILINASPRADGSRVFEKALFLGSGSEAVEAAIKLARQYHVERGQPQRINFIARERSFHGNTLGGLAAGGDFGRRKIYEPLLAKNTSLVSPAYPYRLQHAGESDADYVRRLGAELEATFERLGPDTVCAFLCETIMGSTRGSILPPPGYLAEVRRVCDKYGALLVLDEVMCGLGKTGRFHAWQDEAAFDGPDIQTVAKALGAGFAPISAVLLTDKVLAAIRDGSGEVAHGHTYQAHPVSCAAAVAVQKIIARDGLIEHVRTTGLQLGKMLRDSIGDLWYVGEIRGRGFFWGIELVEDRQTREPFEPELQIAFKILFAARGMGLCILAANGTQDESRCDHLALMLPYVSTLEDCVKIVHLLREAMLAVLGEEKGQKGRLFGVDGVRSN